MSKLMVCRESTEIGVSEEKAYLNYWMVWYAGTVVAEHEDIALRGNGTANC
jgi:hypothetical protein